MLSGRRLLSSLLCVSFATVCVSQLLPQTSDSVHIVPQSKAEKSALAPDAGLARNQTRPMLVNVDIVLVPVTVVETTNRPVTNLVKQNFELYEDGEQQTLRYFSTEDSPISVGVLLDLSYSMKDKIDTARQALHEFFENSNTQDDYFVIGFSDHPALLADSTHSPQSIESKVALAVPYGHTALLDSIYMGLTKLRNARYKRRALLIISDGGDNHSRYDAKEIKKIVQEADVEIYAMGIFDSIFKTYEEWAGKRLLTEISEETGGRTATVDDIAKLP